MPYLWPPMAGFKGQATYNVDAKGRAAIPAKMRAVLSPDAKQTFTALRGFERCISLYPLDQWAAMERDIGSLSTYSREARAFTRRVMMWAEEVKMDKQGRVRLPKSLIRYAGIEGSVLILGAYDRIEVWDPVVFEEYLEGEEASYEVLASRVMAP